MSYERYERGQLNTTNYRCYLKNSATNTLVSPFHDIPLFANKENQVFNAVIEIPRWSNAKMEINKKEKLNPITQDVKKNKLRFVNNCFPHHGYIWNYGALPQTWEDPNVKDETTGCNGDNDPLDVCEIGSKVHQRGSVIQVKILGALGLIDEGEADWKIICIDINDPLASKLNDIEDVETHCPGLLDSTRDWFRIYKIPTGKPANSFAENGKFYNKEFALNQINHDYKLWLNMAQGGYEKTPEKKDGLSLENTSLDYVPSYRLSADEANKIIEKDSENFNSQSAEVDQVAIDAVYYIDRRNYN